jgi:hypothetical protein
MQNKRQLIRPGPTTDGSITVSRYCRVDLCQKKVPPGHEGVWGSGCIDLSFLTSALVGGEWFDSRPGRFTPGRKNPR